MHPQIRSFMQQQIIIQRRTSIDGRGTPTYGTGETIKCYIAGETKMVRNVRGEEVASTSTLYLSGTDTIATQVTVQDLITLPGGTQPPILAINHFYGPQTGDLEIVEVNI